MKYLSAKDLLFIHSAVVDETGGSHGVRDLGLLESAASNPQHSFGGQDLYSSLFDKAAALFHSLIKNHPFVDGNKRTAVTAAAVFLEMNGFILEASKSSLVDFALNIASAKSEVREISKWLNQHARRMKKTL